MILKDPKGYYTRLGVDFNASTDEITLAFRRKAIELHPDRNPIATATEAFQHLNKAYRVLNNEDERTLYDVLCINTYCEEKNKQKNTEQLSHLIACMGCGKAAAQLRHVIYYEVKSFIFNTVRHPVQGIFCYQCSSKRAISATWVTWRRGWWSIPFGPVYTLHAIIQNLIGGKQSIRINAHILAYQARVFFSLKDKKMARVVALEGIKFIKKLGAEKGSDLKEERARLQQLMDQIIVATAKSAQPAKKNNWHLFYNILYENMGILLIIIASLTAIVGIKFLGSPVSTAPPPSQLTLAAQKKSEPRSKLASSVRIKPTSDAQLTSPYTYSDFYLPEKSHKQVEFADNGAPWPSISGYIIGYEKKLTDGHSNVTIDNSHNDADLFVKIFLLNTLRPMVIRVIFIRAHERFIVKNLPEGIYDIRYQDIDSGYFLRTETFKIESTIKDKIKFTNLKRTLYKKTNGDTQIYPISEEEFR